MRPGTTYGQTGQGVGILPRIRDPMEVGKVTCYEVEKQPANLDMPHIDIDIDLVNGIRTSGNDLTYTFEYFNKSIPSRDIKARPVVHEGKIRLSKPETDNTPCLLYTSPSPRDRQKSRMPSSA